MRNKAFRISVVRIGNPILIGCLAGFLLIQGLMARNSFSEEERVLGYINHIPSEASPEREARLRRVAERRQGASIIVHRGASKIAPENTLEAYAAAMDRGADGFEIDIRKSRDGVLYMHHDDDMGRTVAGSGRLRDKTYYEIVRAPLKNVFGPATEKTRIPTLASVLVLARQRAALLHLDIKEGDIQDDIIRMFDEADIWDHVVYVNHGNSEKIYYDPRLRLYEYRTNGRREQPVIEFGFEPLGGEYAFGKTTGWGTTESAGVFQQVRTATGESYACTAFGLSVKQEEGGEGNSPGMVRVGVDLTGETNSQSDRILWSEWAQDTKSWTLLGFPAENPVQAGGELLTIFLEYRQPVATAWNGMYFDDASVKKVKDGKTEEPELLANPGFEEDGIGEIFPPRAWLGWGDGQPDGTTRIGGLPRERLIFVQYDPLETAKGIGRDSFETIPLPEGIRAWWIPEGVLDTGME